ncbi:hypothetical protein SmJEL517_g02163 [Synchytrium microbalum]|uniref:Vacuolar protein-sorting-associated protein 36 n=1 Tax=Synchytrium microbalum TaxID=1806994 RepID=A0A507C7K1_9FUNG|nr:uncharacterized protein SmJEL517_g02163 [Synchytrium microbalum]TPX35582.1 hypothetical protein SmJEL517_g02163 [Synchytrium microbalum]
MQNYTSEVVLSSSLRPVLASGETILLQQRDVGLYEGNTKLLAYDKGVAYLSSHRLLWIPESPHPTSTTIAVALANIVKMEPLPAFLTQSPKIALHLTPKSTDTTPLSASSSSIHSVDSVNDWTCPICSARNRSQDLKCSECGVKKQTIVEPPPASQPPPVKDGKVCRACTFINHIDMQECEVCSTPLANIAEPILPTSTVLLSTPIAAPVFILRLSFRSGGMPDFAKALRLAIQKKEWEKQVETPKVSSPQGRDMMGGIGSIMRNVDQSRVATNESLSEAFRDLDALMQKAAESISTKLASSSASSNEDSSEMAMFREYLVDLGISSPVTKKTAGNMYDTELARQLAEFLEVVLPRSGGMMTMVDVYCIFNRARGVALVSPEDLIRASQQYERIGLPYRLRKFDSGLLVVQSATQNDADTATRVRERVQATKGGLTAVGFATSERISVILAREQLLMAESRALVCRDDSIEGLRFYDNLILYS